MSENNNVNNQITDAVTQTNVPIVNQYVPAIEEGIVETDMQEEIEKTAEQTPE